MVVVKGMWKVKEVLLRRSLKTRALLASKFFTGLVWLAVPVGAVAETVATQPSSPASAVGRVLGMMLFAYLALKWINRKKNRDDDEPRGFLGLRVKPWVVWLVVIGGLGLLMARSG
jgi:hypothetical protein